MHGVTPDSYMDCGPPCHPSRKCDCLWCSVTPGSLPPHPPRVVVAKVPRATRGGGPQPRCFEDIVVPLATASHTAKPQSLWEDTTEGIATRTIMAVFCTHSTTSSLSLQLPSWRDLHGPLSCSAAASKIREAWKVLRGLGKGRMLIHHGH